MRGEQAGVVAQDSGQQEVDALLRQIRELTARSEELYAEDGHYRERTETARELERLRWELADAARSAAERDSGAAA
jgi:hypothetical protein